MSANILVIDDDPDTRDALSLGLSLAGYTIQIAAERVCAIALLREKRCDCDLILMDFNMPGMRAQDFLHELRSFCTVPVVLITGSAHPAEIAARLGLSVWLEKPIDFETLVTVVERELQRQRV